MNEPNQHSGDRDPIDQLREDMGVVAGVHIGQAILLFLLAVARYAGRACSAALIGESGVGKTTIATRVTGLLPPEDTRYVTEVTYAALAGGFGWDPAESGGTTRVYDLRRNLIVLDENADIRCQQTMACLRQATSTEWTRRTKMERGQPVTTGLRGPLTLIDCRLATSEIDYQTTNRLLPILVPADPNSLAEIMELTARRPTIAGLRNDRQIQDTSARWRRFIRGLDDELHVVIDYAPQILLDAKRSVGGRITHGPRLLQAVHAVISAVAWLRQRARQRHSLGESGSFIFAKREDYEAAHRILLAGNVLDERPAIPAPALRLLNRWQLLADREGNCPVTAPALFSRIDVTVDRGNMSRQLRPLLDLELVRELPRNCNRQKQYDLTSLALQATTVSLLHTLPAPDSLLITTNEEYDATAAQAAVHLRPNSANRNILQRMELTTQ